MKDILIKKSKIHGRGIFAARMFRAGEVVVYWDTSNILTKKQVDELPKRELKYVSKYGRKYILHQPPARYMNHSCQPNTKQGRNCDVAVRTIQKGEEITTDYAFEGGPKDNTICNCRSQECTKEMI